MKIAVIHSIYQPETRGGAEVVVANIVAGLKERGDDVCVICVGRKNEVSVVAGIKVYRIKPFNLFNFLDINSKPVWLRFFWHIIDMLNDVQTWWVYQALKKESPDLVLTHNLKGLGYYTPWLLSRLKIKHIHTVHDMQLLHPSGLFDDKSDDASSLVVMIYRWFCQWLFASPPAVIFPSQYIKNVYERFGFFKNSKKIVIGNPIKFKNNNSEFSIKSHIPDPRFQILFLGQLEAYKGIFDLLAALKGVNGQWVLNVVGDGKALLEAKILAQTAFPDVIAGLNSGPRVRFWGRLSHSQLEENIWPQIDILVNPSQVAESFGMVVVEAQAHGIPALVSNRGALPELVREGETGWIFHDKEDLAKKLQWLVNNHDKLLALQETCRQESEKYNLVAYIGQLLAL